MAKRKNYMVQVRMTSAQERYMRENAARLGVSLSTFIILAAMRPIKETGEMIAKVNAMPTAE